MQHSSSSFLAIVLIVVGLALGGCGAAVGAGAAAGTAAMEERGLGAAIDDTVIQTKLNAGWLDHDAKLFVNLSSEVHEGRVLLTGNVQQPRHRVDAVRLAWRIDGVREVINQVQVNDQSGLLDYARDAWITTKLSVKLAIDSRVKAINYSIDTLNGHVFLMGIAQNKTELARVKSLARTVSYVRRVTSYVVQKNDPSRRLKVTLPRAAPRK